MARLGGARNMSADGRWLRWWMSAPKRADYGVVLRRTDGAQTIRLGEGSAQRLSPDGKWAAAIIASPSHVVLYPASCGYAPATTPRPALTRRSKCWSRGSTTVCGSEPSRAPRCYRQGIGGSAPAPITPEGVVASLAPDGRTLLVTRQDGAVQRTAIDGSQVVAVPGLRSSDSIIAWSRDSSAVYVQRSPDVPVRVERVDLATSARTTAREIAPEGVGPITTLYVTDWIDDGKGSSTTTPLNRPRCSW